MSDTRIEEATALMNDFARRTGLVSGAAPRRYLWTDAFAVCNFIGLARATGEPLYLERALQLADQVHHTLGRHRDDDPRKGWISGLAEKEGERHPTRGGLRIGKRLPERRAGEPYDERLEWERDGQYFHYLTRWMHALDQLARTTREPHFNRWARELADTAFRGFSYAPAHPWEPQRMVWKMNIDLTRVLVPSMGHHDPLDGYVSNLQLQATARALPGDGPQLDDATRRYARMMVRSDWVTDDALGLGGLLVDAWRVQQLMQQGAEPVAQLLERLLDDARQGLEHYAQGGESSQPAEYRLAFRELGLAIGLHAAERLQQAVTDPRLRAQVDAIMQYLPLRDAIEAFWRDPVHQRGATWLDHLDINAVMLATSLAPDGYLLLLPPENK